MPFPGPDILGRGLVLRPGQATPAAFRSLPVVRIQQSDLAHPELLLATLHLAWLHRQPTLIVLGADAEALREPQACDKAPWSLPATFEFERERLHFLVWANNYDGTAGSPRWKLAEAAVARLGARLAGEGEEGDIRLPDGRLAWCDGGPRQPLRVPVVHAESMLVGRLRCVAPVEPGQEGAPEALAPDQLRAVLHERGPARVIAPAGSGKTRVMAARLRHLLQVRGYDPESLTAVAYNRRAAEELKERVGLPQARVKTIHALGYELIRRVGEPRVIHEPQVRQIVRSLVPIDPERGRDPLAAWIEALGEVRLGLRDPAEVEKNRGGDVKGFAAFFPRYRRLLRERNQIDHDEQIYGALEILLTRPEERRAAQRQCRHMLVDEFQDLTPAYLLLLRILAAPGWQVYGVGDDDQVIYGYLGATPQYLVDFEKLFPGASAYALERNYRCPAQVVEAASHLLPHNRLRVQKTIAPAPDRHDDEPQVTVETVAGEKMAARAVEGVLSWMKSGGRPEDVVVLCRVNEGLLPMQVALGEVGIRCSTPLDVDLLERTGVRATLAWLAVATGPDRMDATLLQETLRHPSRKIRRATSDLLSRQASWTVGELRQFARGLEEWEGRHVDDWVRNLGAVRAVGSEKSTGSILRYVRKQVGLELEMQQLDESHSDAGAGTHVDELVALEQVASMEPDPRRFEAFLRGALSRRATGRGGVHLSSIHRVKGMEWDFVVLFSAHEGMMPHRLACGRTEEVEEERRLFHVAITRARRRLLVLADEERPSRFLREMSGAEPVKERKGRGVRLRGKREEEGEPRVVAAVGLVVEAPHEGVVARLRETYALIELPSGAKMRVPYGERVTVGGQVVRLGRPPRNAG